MKILLTGGGSGGHILPALAVAAALKRKQPESQLWFVGSRKASDRDLVSAAGISFYSISTGKLRRYWAWANIGDGFRFALGCWQAYWLVRRLAPDVVFAKGGHVTLPVIVAAGWRRIPVVACESDAVIGLSTRLGWRWISKVATAFPIAVVAKNTPRITADKLVFTGLPLDEKWQTVAARKPFANERATLLIMGGSQGASLLNQMIAGVIEEILEICNVVHYTGRLSYSTIMGMYDSLAEEQKANLIVRDFDTEEYRSFVKGADLVVARAGSSALELAALGKPAILIPLPGSAANHQERNARFLAEVGAVVWLKQDRKLAEELLGKIRELVADRERLRLMGNAARHFGEINWQAADELADLVMGTAKS